MKTQQPEVSSEKNVNIIRINIVEKPPRILKPADINIKVLTPNVMEEINKSLDDGDIDQYVYYAFTPEAYLDFSIWLENVLAYIKKQNEIIQYYENSIEQINENIIDSEEK